MGNRIILILVFTILSINHAFADCYTGFACSIKDLEKQKNEEINKNIEIFKKYLNQKNTRNNIITRGTIIKNYNDLFFFNTIL